jgi:hypothetical protein
MLFNQVVHSPLSPHFLSIECLENLFMLHKVLLTVYILVFLLFLPFRNSTQHIPCILTAFLKYFSHHFTKPNGESNGVTGLLDTF